MSSGLVGRSYIQHSPARVLHGFRQWEVAMLVVARPRADVKRELLLLPSAGYPKRCRLLSLPRLFAPELTEQRQRQGCKFRLVR